MGGPSLSRRGLFGAGLRRAIDARLDELEPRELAKPVRRRVHDPSPQLGDSLRPVAEAMTELAGVREGDAILTVAAGNAAVRAAAIRRGARVESSEAVRLDFPDESFDGVLAFFSATSHPDARLVAEELKRVARPGAPIVLATWSGRPWARYETAYRHFFDFPELDVHERELPESGMRYSLVFCRKP